MPTFMADECFSGPLIRSLVAAGYDVVRSADTLPSGADADVLALVYAEGRVLLTEDNDFGDLTVRLGHATHGVIRVDLKTLDRVARSDRLLGALAKLGDDVIGALVTIEPRRTRIRSLRRPPTGT